MTCNPLVSEAAQWSCCANDKTEDPISATSKKVCDCIGAGIDFVDVHNMDRLRALVVGKAILGKICRLICDGIDLKLFSNP